ncbi:UNVERIFIED_CONTAM: Ricin B-like lectin EULS3 [Sesamum angustifolium]|uniref:Ricin B-like lectin EULS3 n=1 Tax=Sesamum angustifolium TaxID=2727405 RepID=A0AAW2LAE8_9LAMI
MDYPHGHHHHHHHRDRREEEEYPPPARPPPPPFYGENEPPPPFPPPPNVYHHSHTGPGPDYSPPFPPPPQVHHSSHTGPGPDYYPPPPPPTFPDYSPPPPPAVDSPHHHHNHMPHFPSSFAHHTHHSVDEFANKPSVKMFCKAETNYSLSIRDGKVILARSDPYDPFQHWIRDEKFSTRVKDEEGFPSFALINKATGQAMKHSIGATHPVQLIPYNPNALDESILWTESKDLGDGYRAIRMVNNIRLNVDAFHGDKNHGGVRDGSLIVLWEWKKGDNQRWKIVPYCESLCIITKDYI